MKTAQHLPLESLLRPVRLVMDQAMAYIESKEEAARVEGDAVARDGMRNLRTEVRNAAQVLSDLESGVLPEDKTVLRPLMGVVFSLAREAVTDPTVQLTEKIDREGIESAQNALFHVFHMLLAGCGTSGHGSVDRLALRARIYQFFYSKKA